jgi:hypothetical protein
MSSSGRSWRNRYDAETALTRRAGLKDCVSDTQHNIRLNVSDNSSADNTTQSAQISRYSGNRDG